MHKLEYYKSIWKKKDVVVKAEIVRSLEEQVLGEYSQTVYYEYWKKLIRMHTGLDCDPLDYLRAFSYKTFSDYWRACGQESKKKK